MAFDYSLLRGKVREKQMTLAQFAGLLGISNTSLYARLNGNVPFNQDEIWRAVECLSMKREDIPALFFRKKEG